MMNSGSPRMWVLTKHLRDLGQSVQRQMSTVGMEGPVACCRCQKQAPWAVPFGDPVLGLRLRLGLWQDRIPQTGFSSW